jgi:iron complex outermembrane receptor protein
MLSSALPLFAAEPPVPPQETVVVTAPRPNDDFASLKARLGLTGRSLLDTPASATVVTRALMDEQGARNVTAVIGNDASVGENYAPLGYYEALAIRGFTLDSATGFKRDGLTIDNESSMPLENKESVEILKGVAGFEAGQAAPGGVVNYVVKRPQAFPVRRLTLEESGRGTRYAAVDFGASAGRFGLRFNAAHENFHPYVREAVGERNFLSAALEWRPSESATISLDGDWQKKSQLSVPGLMGLGGNALPRDPNPEQMLNNQPWSRPVAIESSNIGGRLAYDGGVAGRFSAAYNRNLTRSEDYAAFPYGCSSGATYLYTFCANGDYDLYDYRSSGEVRTASSARLDWSLERSVGNVRHELSVGLSRYDRTVALGAEVYDYVGTDNLYASGSQVFAPSPNSTGVVHRNQDYTEQALTLRDAITLSPRWHADLATRVSGVSDDHFRKADGVQSSSFRRTLSSPQAALSFAPSAESRVYASYAQGLELGGTAPATAANAGEILNPKISRQLEFGVKRAISSRLMASAAVFHIWKPLEFLDESNVLVQRGRVVHDGAELSAFGRAADSVRVAASATFIRARQNGTGTAAFDGRTPVNVPWWRSQATIDWEIPTLAGAGLDLSWARVSAKFARRDNALSVPGYDRFDGGVRYGRLLGGARMVWRARIENLLNAVYWKDSGEYFGDGYLHLGAPRTFRVTAELNF